ncbi:MAG: response regulator [Chloroflexota bacterium]
MARTILVIDDESNLRWVLEKALHKAGYDVVTASRGDEGLRQFARHPIDLVLLDLKMPGMDGLTVLRELRQRNRTTPIFLLTAYATVPTAVEALKIGATDYVRKPFDLEDLQTKISYVLHIVHNEALDSTHNTSNSSEQIIGISSTIRQVRDTVTAVAQNDYPVLLVGERGSGRRFIAKWLHQQSVNSVSSNLVVIDCGVLPHTVLESELGRLVRNEPPHPIDQSDQPERWEQALGGSLVLANIEAMARKSVEQLFENVKSYLRSSHRPHGLRLLLTSCERHNDSLSDRSAQPIEQFTLNKFPRTITINVPPLRNRSEDIPLFIASFTPDLTWDDDVRQALLGYSWPENVAELKQMLRYVATMANGSPVAAAHQQYTWIQIGRTALRHPA